METKNPKSLKFGGFTLDPVECRLTRRGRRIELKGKPLELLTLLARRAPRLVTREEIRTNLWPDRVVEYDSAINACVRDIRHALRDDAKHPRFVETVPRRGYRFLARVSARHSATDGRRRRLVAGALAAVVLAAGGFWILSAPDESGTAPPAAAARKALVMGKQLLATHEPEDARRAVPLFEEAVSIEPGYAEAWAALADAHYFRYERPQLIMPAADEAVARALALDPDLARAHRRLADLRFVWHWQFGQAEVAYRRALELDAGAAETHHSYAAFLVAMERDDEALAHMRRALAIDPLSTVLHGDLAWFHSMAGRHEQAIEECNLLLELAPGNRRALACPLRPLLALGRLEQAASIVAQQMPASDTVDGPAAVQIERYWRWRLETQQAALAAGDFVEPVAMALTHARLGDPARAIEWIERAREARSRLFVYLRLFPEFRALHEHPRFINAAFLF